MSRLHDFRRLEGLWDQQRMSEPSRASLITRLSRGFSVLRTDVMTVQVLRSFSAEGVDAILLKGPAHRLWLYGRRVEHPYGDADLLVAPAQFAAARALLMRDGFEIVADDSDTPGHTPHAHHWARREDGANVDLHRTLYGARATPRKVWGTLVERTEVLSIADGQARVLDEAGRAMHVAIHAIQHPQAHKHTHEHTRADLRRALSIVDESTWEDALDLARRIDAEAAFGAGLRLDPAGVGLAQRLGLREIRDREIEIKVLGDPAGALGLNDVGAAPRFGAKLGMVTRKLFPTPRLIRVWSPLARRGRIGLALAYAGRPFWVLARVPSGLRTRRKLNSLEARPGSCSQSGRGKIS